MKISLTRSIFYLLLLIPISFKLKLSESVAVYPQEILIPLLFLLFYMVKPGELKWYNERYLKPFYLLFAGLLVVQICTLLSFFNIFSISGFLKTFKYLLYCFTIFLLAKHDFFHFSRLFIKAGVWVVSLTLALFFYKFLTYGVGIQDFYQRAMWVVDLVPSGFSNLNLNLKSFEFERSTGNHGIYGSYLVLLYLFILSSIRNSDGGFTIKNSVYLLLIVFNLFLLPSRESLLIFVVINLIYFLSVVDFRRLKLRNLVIFLVFSATAIGYLVFSETEIVLLSKIRYTINSYLEGGREGNISLRFNVWYLTLLSFTLFPLHLLIGYGYNTPNFVNYLTETNNFYMLRLDFATVPESFFFQFLSYGGLISLFLAFLYFTGVIYNTFRIRKVNSLGLLFFSYTIMLFITNNTGGSMLSDLLFTQYAMVYIFLFKLNEE